MPFAGIEMARGAVMQSLLRIEINDLKAEIAKTTPDNPALNGYKCYSQFDEDGILDHLCRAIGVEKGVFVEFGAGNGLENNTHLLALKGWRGLWIDGDPKNAAYIRENIRSDNGVLAFDSSFINKQNVLDVTRRGLDAVQASEPDLISMDLDGNDVYLIEVLLKEWRPKILVAEYNGKLPYGLRISVPYDENSWRKGDDFYGASLSEIVFRVPGYKLVCCGLSGVNAFFVRDDLACLFPDLSPASLYMPSRAHFTLLSVGSRPSLKFLAGVVSGEIRPS